MRLTPEVNRSMSGVPSFVFAGASFFDVRVEPARGDPAFPTIDADLDDVSAAGGSVCAATDGLTTGALGFLPLGLFGAAFGFGSGDVCIGN